MNSTETNQTNEPTTEYSPDFQVFVPSPYTYIVQCKWDHSRVIFNERELREDAGRAVEPMIRERWGEYWRAMALKAAQHIVKQPTNNELLHELMNSGLHNTPSMYYPCPTWLAARAVVGEK